MGWLIPEKQKEIKRKYKVECTYECDFCHLPIPPGALMEIDPKGGYHPWPKTVPVAVRTFRGREPKVTYHVGGDCEDMRKGRKKRKFFKKQMLQAAERILDKIEYKPKIKWAKERCIKYLKKKGYEEKVITKALRFIRKEKLIKKKDGGYVIAITKRSTKKEKENPSRSRTKRRRGKHRR